MTSRCGLNSISALRCERDMTANPRKERLTSMPDTIGAQAELRGVQALEAGEELVTAI